MSRTRRSVSLISATWEHTVHHSMQLGTTAGLEASTAFGRPIAWRRAACILRQVTTGLWCREATSTMVGVTMRQQSPTAKALVALIAIAVISAGCGGGEPAGGNTTAASPTTKATHSKSATSPTSASASSAPAGSTTLRNRDGVDVTIAGPIYAKWVAEGGQSSALDPPIGPERLSRAAASCKNSQAVSSS
jgi:hypothetical protein